MTEILVLEWLTASDLAFWQWNDCGWCTDIDGLAILDGTRLALVSATAGSDVEQRLLHQSVGAAAVAGGR
jgi:hypothetical protein